MMGDFKYRFVLAIVRLMGVAGLIERKEH